MQLVDQVAELMAIGDAELGIRAIGDDRDPCARPLVGLAERVRRSEYPSANSRP